MDVHTQDVYTLIVKNSLGNENARFIVSPTKYATVGRDDEVIHLYTVTDVMREAGKALPLIFKPVTLLFYYNSLCYGSITTSDTTEARMWIQSFVTDPYTTIQKLRS